MTSVIQSCYNVPMTRQKQPAEGFQRVTVDMPKDLYEQLRRVSFESRDSMNKIVVSIVQEHIAEYKAKAKADTE